ncbi:MAG: hypothetical protein U5L08_06535 [Xanthomonadales bacterium]|nr:hypothetical protein [Xanthomonadales bacterium]
MLTTPQSVGYTLAIGFMFGNLMTYVSTAEQVFTGVYGLGQAFTLVFGAIAFAVVAASFSNSRIVERVGMRRCPTARSWLSRAVRRMAAFGFPADPPLVVHALFCAATFFCFGHMLAQLQRAGDGAAGPGRRRRVRADRLLDDGGRRQLRRPGRPAVRRHGAPGDDRVYGACAFDPGDRPGDERGRLFRVGEAADRRGGLRPRPCYKGRARRPGFGPSGAHVDPPSAQRQGDSPHPSFMPEHGHLNDVLVILLAAICCVALFQRLRITPRRATWWPAS